MKLLAMSGFIPEQICDVKRFTGFTGERNISYYCGYANDFISQVISDANVDGAVFPKSCDSSRIINSYLSHCKKYTYQINVPARNDVIAVDFFAKELKLYKESLERYFEREIDDIPKRIEKINIRNKMLGICYRELERISYGSYIRLIHDNMSLPLWETEDISVSHLGRKDNVKHRVFLVGSFLSNCHIADIIEEHGMGIVGDNLPESGRIKDSYIDAENGDVFHTISEDILRRRMSPTQNNFSEIVNNDLTEIRSLGAEAVIFITQKYCEAYDYLYAVYKKKLDMEHIPSLRLFLSDSEDEQRVSLYVEAFADTL